MQIASIRSLLATQRNYKYKVWLWIDIDCKEINEGNPWLSQIAPFIEIKYYDQNEVKKDPILSKCFVIFEEKERLAMRGDCLRIWALHNFGGFYFDLDVMFLRDMKQLLLGPEFVYSWEKQNYANTAILFFRKNSYLNEYVAKKVVRMKSTQPWALFKYDDRKLKSLRLYNSCLFDPLWNDDNKEYPIHSFQEFFTKKVEDKDTENPFPYSYAYHWHNNWNIDIDDESLFAKLERKNSASIEKISFESRSS